MYEAKLINSSRVLNVIEQAAAVTCDADSLIFLTREHPLLIKPDYWYTLHITCDKAKPPEYDQYYIVDTDGKYYYTGSSTFYENFIQLMETIENADNIPEEWYLKVYQKDSKNYSDKKFLTCTLV